MTYYHPPGPIRQSLKLLAWVPGLEEEGWDFLTSTDGSPVRKRERGKGRDLFLHYGTVGGLSENVP